MSSRFSLPRRLRSRAATSACFVSFFKAEVSAGRNFLVTDFRLIIDAPCVGCENRASQYIIPLNLALTNLDVRDMRESR